MLRSVPCQTTSTTKTLTMIERHKNKYMDFYSMFIPVISPSNAQTFIRPILHTNINKRPRRNSSVTRPLSPSFTSFPYYHHHYRTILIQCCQKKNENPLHVTKISHFHQQQQNNKLLSSSTSMTSKANVIIDYFVNSFHLPSISSCLLLKLFSITTVSCFILLLPLCVNAKNLLTENTIFRRYLITDSAAILRYSIPLPSERVNDPQPAAIREIQDYLERLGVHQKSRGIAGLISSRRDLNDLQKTLSLRQLDVLLEVPAKNRSIVAEQLAKLESNVAEIAKELGDSGPVLGQNFLPPQFVRAEQTLRDAFTPRNSMKQVTNYDVGYIERLRTEALDRVGEIEEIAVQGMGPTFRIPRRYNSLPRLLGRARVTIELEKKSGVWRRSPTDSDSIVYKTSTSSSSSSSSVTKPKSVSFSSTSSNSNDSNHSVPSNRASITLILDGFSAPLTAGNFVDLIQRKDYDGYGVSNTQREFYALFGNDLNNNNNNKSTRREIPLEILVNGEPTPIYGSTLDEAGVADLQPMLPVTAFGAIAMVHSVENPNDASQQFYIYLLDPTSYQARSYGGSVLTGSVATFGYVTKGKEIVSQLEPGDFIVSAKVVEGLENFKLTGDS